MNNSIANRAGWSGDAGRSERSCPRPRRTIFWLSFHGIALGDPVGVEIVGEDQNAEMGEAHVVQAPGRLDGYWGSGASGQQPQYSTILALRGSGFAQSFRLSRPCAVAAGAVKGCAGNVRAFVESVGSRRRRLWVSDSAVAEEISFAKSAGWTVCAAVQGSAELSARARLGAEARRRSGLASATAQRANEE